MLALEIAAGLSVTQKKAAKAIRDTIRGWKLPKRSEFCGPSGNKRSCATICAERHTGLHASRVALRSCLLIARWECGEAP